MTLADLIARLEEEKKANEELHNDIRQLKGQLEIVNRKLYAATRKRS